MAGIIANYVFAYGFVTDISNERYFEGATLESDMETVRISEPWRPFLNEVGWYHSMFDVEPDEQSKLYVFGERIRSVDDGTLLYIGNLAYDEGQVITYDIQEDILNARLKFRDVIDGEAFANKTKASFLLFLNDRNPFEKT